MSLERRGDASANGSGAAAPLPPARPVVPDSFVRGYEAAGRVLRDGPVPLVDPVPGMADRERLHVAVIIPPFQRGSGGHNTIFQIVSRLEAMGHTCSVWHDDPFGHARSKWPAVLRREISEFFAPIQAPVYTSFDHWYGADVVMATGWQTVYPALLLDNCRARVYLVNDHEPEFYATSVESYLAERTYAYDFFCIAASPWLRDVLVDRYGLPATDFQLGVDHGVYRPQPIERSRDTVIYYSRAVTGRRAVPFGLLALEELSRRRPQTRIVLYGDPGPAEVRFPCESLGIISPEQLAWAYSQATVGLSLSMTNLSLIPKEMLACGLPCVELAGVSAESVFGVDGPIELAPLDPSAIAAALERLLDDRRLWEERSAAGIAFVREHTWDVAAQQVEQGVREALRLREAIAPAI
jgi:glycosyltransferase involved in cell wall biosynthesis